MTSLARVLRTSLVAALFSATFASAQVVSIAGLFTTGVNNSGVALGANVVDPHYVVTGTTDPGTTLGNAYTVSPDVWGANTSAYRWIVSGNTAGTNGNDANRASGATFDYTLTFDLPTGAILNTASLAGTFRADDTAAIFLNGSQIYNGGTYGSSTNFSTSAPNFVSTNNTLTFRVANNNGGTNPTGLLVSALSGTVQLSAVPEVGAFAPMAGLLLVGGLLWLRSRSRRSPVTPAAPAA